MNGGAMIFMQKALYDPTDWHVSSLSEIQGLAGISNHTSSGWDLQAYHRANDGDSTIGKPMSYNVQIHAQAPTFSDLSYISCVSSSP